MSHKTSPATLGGEGPRDATTYLRGDGIWASPGAPASLDELGDVDTSTNPPTDTQGLLWNAGVGLWVPGYPVPAEHAHRGGKFLGNWEAPGADELIYSEDFSAGKGAWTGPSTVISMASAIGSDKPAYGFAAQHGIVSTNSYQTTHEMNLATLPEALGRTLTSLKMWHNEDADNNVSRTNTFQVLVNGGIVYSVNVFDQSNGRPWKYLEVPDPGGVIQLRHISSGSSGNATVRRAVTGVELYAAPEGDLGYLTGEYVVHNGRLWRSVVDSNTAEPSFSAPEWMESPLVGETDEWRLKGTGSPEGVVSAAVGTTYVDTAATNGAILWTKASGTGNTGWRVADGDTGWRRVVAAGSIATMPNLTVYIRRRNDLCNVLTVEPTAGGTQGTGIDLWAVPLGFRIPASLNPLGYAAIPVANESGVTLAANLAVNSVNNLRMYGTVNGARHYANLNYTVSDPWPTTLPGTAA